MRRQDVVRTRAEAGAPQLPTCGLEIGGRGRAGNSRRALSGGLGPGGIALRAPTPATRSCYPLVNHATKDARRSQADSASEFDALEAVSGGRGSRRIFLIRVGSA